jgi:hypothetical protein
MSPRKGRGDVVRQALRRRATELQAKEIAAEGKAHATDGVDLDHDAIDDRVLEALVTEAEENPLWTKAAFADYVGRARGTVRAAQGPQVTEEKGQLSFLRTRDTLLAIDEQHSQYLGVLVEKQDLPRLDLAARRLEEEAESKDSEARIARAKARGVRDVASDVLNERAVEWEGDDEVTAAA